MSRSSNGTYTTFPQMDARNDLGYGRTRLKFSKPRIQGSAYPYSMTDEEEEESEDIADVEVTDVPIGFDSKTQRFIACDRFLCSCRNRSFLLRGWRD